MSYRLPALLGTIRHRPVSHFELFPCLFHFGSFLHWFGGHRQQVDVLRGNRETRTGNQSESACVGDVLVLVDFAVIGDVIVGPPDDAQCVSLFDARGGTSGVPEVVASKFVLGVVGGEDWLRDKKG